MNALDIRYKELLMDIMANGVEKSDRTGTGTVSVFGRQIRHKMSDGFPLLTTKKIAVKSMMTELKWFLKGDTNIKYLVDNGCHIWNGDAYKNYINNDTTVGKSIIYKNKTYKIKDQHNSNPNYVIIDDVNSSVVDLRWDDVLFDNQYIPQEEFINKIKTDDEFAKKWGELGPIYGKQWRSWEQYREIGQHYSSKTQKIEESDISRREPIDQIQNLINELKTNPDSRRLMVNAWNVGELDQMALPPCHYGFQVYTRELSFEERWELAKRFGYVVEDATIPSADAQYSSLNAREELNSMWNDKVLKTNLPTRAISLMWNQRSVDTFLGLPFNIASYGTLLILLAKEVNMVPDELIGNLGDVHLYSNHIEQAKIQCGRQSYYLPKFEVINSDIKNGEFSYELINYKFHPAIKAPLSN